ncbi:hypothetical protein BofuT4_P042130.1 [Botrytis cinerea T4]|uniref:Uncharacterized protein n=1 Tax=Botryotinia fuckeliana (strain T4) TaxID=999810 RepID=G2Y1R2_BOTF4|nr:hypothetical protein BofuT4_P042130.1 [Botrytis cinerea T4]
MTGERRGGLSLGQKFNVPIFMWHCLAANFHEAGFLTCTYANQRDLVSERAIRSTSELHAYLQTDDVRAAS